MYTKTDPYQTFSVRHKRDCSFVDNIFDLPRDEEQSNPVQSNDTDFSYEVDNVVQTRNEYRPHEFAHAKIANQNSPSTIINTQRATTTKRIFSDPLAYEDESSYKDEFLASLSRDFKPNPIIKSEYDSLSVTSHASLENSDIYSTSDPFKIESLQIQAPAFNYATEQRDLSAKSNLNSTNNKPFFRLKNVLDYETQYTKSFNDPYLDLGRKGTKLNESINSSYKKKNDCTQSPASNSSHNDLTGKLSKLPSSVYHMFLERFGDSTSIYSKAVNKSNRTNTAGRKRAQTLTTGHSQRLKPTAKCICTHNSKFNSTKRNKGKMKSKMRNIGNRDLIRIVHGNNCIYFKNQKILPIKSVDKFTLYNGSMIAGNVLVKKANFSVSKLLKIMDNLTIKPDIKKHLKGTNKNMRKRPKIRMRGKNKYTTPGLTETTPNFLLKLIDFMGLKPNAEVTTGSNCKYSTMFIGKDLFYNISKNMPLIGKKQEFELANGSTILGEDLLKSADFNAEKVKEFLNNNKKTLPLVRYRIEEFLGSTLVVTTERLTIPTVQDNVYYIQSEDLNEVVTEAFKTPMDPGCVIICNSSIVSINAPPDTYKNAEDPTDKNAPIGSLNEKGYDLTTCQFTDPTTEIFAFNESIKEVGNEISYIDVMDDDFSAFNESEIEQLPQAGAETLFENSTISEMDLENERDSEIVPFNENFRSIDNSSDIVPINMTDETVQTLNLNSEEFLEMGTSQQNESDFPTVEETINDLTTSLPDIISSTNKSPFENLTNDVNIEYPTLLSEADSATCSSEQLNSSDFISTDSSIYEEEEISTQFSLTESIISLSSTTEDESPLSPECEHTTTLMTPLILNDYEEIQPITEKTTLLESTTLKTEVVSIDDEIALFTHVHFSQAKPHLPSDNETCNDLSTDLDEAKPSPSSQIHSVTPPVGLLPPDDSVILIAPFSGPGFPNPAEIPTYFQYPNGSIAYVPSNFLYSYIQNNPFAQGYQFEHNPSDYYLFNMLSAAQQLYPHLYTYGALPQTPFNLTSVPYTPFMNLMRTNYFNKNPQLGLPTYYQTPLVFNYSGELKPNVYPYSIYPSIHLFSEPNSQPNSTNFNRTYAANSNTSSINISYPFQFALPSIPFIEPQETLLSDLTTNQPQSSSPSLDNPTAPVSCVTHFFEKLLNTLSQDSFTTMFPIDENIPNIVQNEIESIIDIKNSIPEVSEESSTPSLQNLSFSSNNVTKNKTQMLPEDFFPQSYMIELPPTSSAAAIGNSDTPAPDSDFSEGVPVTGLPDLRRTHLFVKIEPFRKPDIGTELILTEPTNILAKFAQTNFETITIDSVELEVTPNVSSSRFFYKTAFPQISLDESHIKNIKNEEGKYGFLNDTIKAMVKEKQENFSSELQTKDSNTTVQEEIFGENQYTLGNIITAPLNYDDKEVVTDSCAFASPYHRKNSLTFDEMNIFPLIVVESDSTTPPANEKLHKNKTQGYSTEVTENTQVFKYSSASSLLWPTFPPTTNKPSSVKTSTFKQVYRMNSSTTKELPPPHTDSPYLSKMTIDADWFTHLRVPIVLSENMRTVWTLSDFMKLAKQNNSVCLQNVTFYIHDGFSPISANKEIILANGSSAILGNLIKDVGYSYPKFMQAINVKPNLKEAEQQSGSHKKQANASLPIRPSINYIKTPHSRPCQLTACVCMTKNGNRITYYPECLGKSPRWNDIMYVERILLPSKFDSQSFGSAKTTINLKKPFQSRYPYTPPKKPQQGPSLFDTFIPKPNMVNNSKEDDPLAKSLSELDNVSITYEFEPTSSTYDSYDEDSAPSSSSDNTRSLIFTASLLDQTTASPNVKLITPRASSVAYGVYDEALSTNQNYIHQKYNNLTFTSEPDIEFLDSAYEETPYSTTVRVRLIPPRLKHRLLTDKTKSPWNPTLLDTCHLKNNQSIVPSTTPAKQLSHIGTKKNFAITNRFNSGFRKRPITFQLGSHSRYSVSDAEPSSTAVYIYKGYLYRASHKKRPNLSLLSNNNGKMSVKNKDVVRPKEYVRKSHRRHGAHKKYPVVSPPGIPINVENSSNSDYGWIQSSTVFPVDIRTINFKEDKESQLLTDSYLSIPEPLNLDAMDYEFTNLENDLPVTPSYQHSEIMNNEKILSMITTKFRRTHPVTQGQPVLQIRDEESVDHIDDRFLPFLGFKGRSELSGHGTHKIYHPESSLIFNQETFDDISPNMYKYKGRRTHTNRNGKAHSKNDWQLPKLVPSLQKLSKPAKRIKHGKNFHKFRHLPDSSIVGTNDNTKQNKKFDPIEAED